MPNGVVVYEVVVDLLKYLSSGTAGIVVQVVGIIAVSLCFIYAIVLSVDKIAQRKPNDKRKRID